MNGGIDETNNSEHGLSSNSSTSLSSTNVQNKLEKINLRASISNDSNSLTPNKMNTTINHKNEDNLSLTPSQIEENSINKSFKRKAVSFSAMPCEKKVADGKI